MPRTSQACDPCKRRKVRCNGERDCQQCTHLGLTCQYSKIDPAVRTRRGVFRDSIINQHRGSFPLGPRRVELKSGPVKLRSSSNDPSPVHDDLAFDNEYFTNLVDDYSTYVFPFLPIISSARFHSLVSKRELRGDDGALVHALAAVTINMTRVQPRHDEDEFDQIQKLYTRALELRGMIMPDSPITIENTLIPLLVSICLFAKRSNIKMGFFFLREAITRLQVLEDREMSMQEDPHLDTAIQLERLHWVLFIHERFVTIAYNHTAILTPLPTSLTPRSTVEEDLLTEGFNHLIHLFTIIDATFIEHWLNRQSPSLTVAWVDSKQLELGLDMDIWEIEISNLTEMQQIDLIVTRYWLHMLLWQMALSKMLLNSSVDEDFRSIMFPIRLSRRLRSILTVIEPAAVQVHGTGIVQKVFEITNTIADIIIHVPIASTTGQSSEDNFNVFLFLYSFLLRMSEFHPIEEAVLKEKSHKIQSMITHI